MMRRFLRLFAYGALALAAGYLHAYPLAAQDGARSGPPKSGPDVGGVKPALDRYCVTCHNATLKTGGLSLENLDPALAGRNPDTWEKVARKLRTREMPPPGLPRPGPASVLAPGELPRSGCGHRVSGVSRASTR